MKDKSKNNIFVAKTILVFLALTILIAAATETALAKSLFVIADINANPQPLQAYDIGPDGTLTFQAEYYIPRRMLGGVGLAFDSDNEQLFVTYEASEDIGLVDAKTMMFTGRVTAPDASNLAGVVYDHDKQLLYCVDRQRSRLYVYSWDPSSKTLSHVHGSPFTLRRATAYGIALDEINDVLYVANSTKSIYVYDTSTWALLHTITVSRVAISIAVDVRNGYLYFGGGYAGNQYLTQYNLASNTEKEVQVETDAGVMGLGVDTDTGFIYMSTGNDTIPGGDNLLVYDASLKRIDKISAIGNPTGLVVPSTNVGYNPLNLTKQVTEGVVGNNELDQIQSFGAGGRITYTICFDNFGDDTVTDLAIVDTLPSEVSFVSADENGIFGQYDPVMRTYTWLYPSLLKGATACLNLTVQVNEDIELGTSFLNSVTISSGQTPPTTTGVEVYTTSNPLHIKKSVVGAFADEVMVVDPGDNISYRIHFSNNDNDFRASGILIVDYLPEELTFVSADYDQVLGRYDADTHSYIWRYPAMQPEDATHIILTAQVKPDVIPGTTITNSVVIDSNETSESVSSVDIIVSGSSAVNRFNLSKSVVGAIDGIKKVGLNGEVTYRICFDGNDIDKAIANVSINDFLPEEVSFVSADGDGIIGKYDENKHMYKWSYPYILLGDVISLDITVRVNQDVALGKTITNEVEISSEETPTAKASADVIITGEWQVENVLVVPDTIRRGGTITNIIIVLELPEGISKDDVKNERITLSERDPNQYTFSIPAHEQIVRERNGKTEVIAMFDVVQFLDAIPDYGQVSFDIKGQLNSGQFFSGEGSITITRFAN